MEISNVQINKVFRSYQTQSRIAELNKKANIQSTQGQVDRVNISPQARGMAALKLISKATPQTKASQTDPVEKNVRV